MKNKERTTIMLLLWTRSPVVNYSNIGTEADMGMKKASGGDFSLRQGAGKSSRTPRDGFGDDGGGGTFCRFLIGCLRFSRDGEYMGERRSRLSPSGPRHALGAARP